MPSFIQRLRCHNEVHIATAGASSLSSRSRAMAGDAGAPAVPFPSLTHGEVIKCKAAVAYGPGQPLVMEEILVDPPAAMEVRVRIRFTSICHTDLSAWLAEPNRRFRESLDMKPPGLGAVWNTADVQPGATVAVFGLGAVGLAVVEGARMRGASRIIGVDINADKRIKGEAFGITDFVNPKDLDTPAHQRITEMTGGAGVDFSFECAGNVEVLREAFFSTHERWGLTVILGIHLSPKMLPVHPMELFGGRKTVGSVFGGFKGKSQLPGVAKKCLTGEVKLEEFITHEMPFADINQAMQLLSKGECLRCLLHL